LCFPLNCLYIVLSISIMGKIISILLYLCHGTLVPTELWFRKDSGSNRTLVLTELQFQWNSCSNGTLVLTELRFQ